jgi:hypothetical protein
MFENDHNIAGNKTDLFIDNKIANVKAINFAKYSKLRLNI